MIRRLQIVQIDLACRIHMGECDLVDVFRIIVLHSFHDSKMFLIGILHTAFVGKGKLGELAHAVLEGSEDGDELTVFGVVDDLGMVLEIIFTEFFDRTARIHDLL